MLTVRYHSKLFIIARDGSARLTQSGYVPAEELNRASSNRRLLYFRGLTIRSIFRS
jgi:hypothetical protein